MLKHGVSGEVDNMTDMLYEKQGSYLQGKREGREEGRKEGVSETKQENILGMFKEGLSAEAIARVVNYSVEDVQKILNEADSK